MTDEQRYTEDDYEQFCKLVRMSSSLKQMERIESRLYMPMMIQRLSKDVCDEMFARLEKEEPLP